MLWLQKWFSESGSYYLCKMPFSQGIKEGTYLHIGKVEIVVSMRELNANQSQKLAADTVSG